MSYRLGIDVGGTHTDAVILDAENRLVAKTKSRTTEDVTTGITNALKQILSQAGIDRGQVSCAMLGTTHCTNAITERKGLNKVGVIRMGAPATRAIRPLFAWPPDLRDTIARKTTIIRGGHEFDGREIASPDEKEIDAVAREMAGRVEAIAITSVFSPVNPAHEQMLAARLRQTLGAEVSITLSHEIGSLGLLERENATVLNAALIKSAARAIAAFTEAMKREGVRAKLFLGQNDGTLMSIGYALRYPIFTIASGPSNSLRGGAVLSNLKDAIVVDVGGTTTDIGVLTKGFPRESAVAVEIGGVKTNFRMPDLLSIGLGGGSRVHINQQGIRVGPDSVGYRLVDEALVFGGRILTATDVAVAMGRARLGDDKKLSGRKRKDLRRADRLIKRTVERAIDAVKLNPEPTPVVLVGGGSILLPDRLTGASEVYRPENYEVANAIGVAIAPVSAQIDRVFSYEQVSRQEALNQAQEMVCEKARQAGADEDSVALVELEEIPLAYLPGNAVRIRAKAAGRLRI